MLREEQIDIRRKRAAEGRFRIQNLGRNRVFSDYQVTNPQSGGQYQVSVRGFDVGDNACTCPDFRTNTLGTCKHIEAVLETLRAETPPTLQHRKAAVTRPEVYLHYGEQLLLEEALTRLQGQAPPNGAENDREPDKGSQKAGSQTHSRQ